jgi:tripeptide aminopeptidase
MGRVADPYGSPLAGELAADVLERFLRYVRIDTQSDRDSEIYPSTARQLDLSRLLLDELRGLGLEAELTENGYVLATLPAVGTEGGPTVGLLAHVDTSPDAPATGVDPQVWRDYDGGEIALPGDPAQVLSPATSPLLAERIGHDLVTSDRPTLLGHGDQGAGVAEIRPPSPGSSAHPGRPQARARIGFTVDEEVGHGVDRFDLDRFGADFAYTLDGQVVGEIENETFSAVELKRDVQGVGVHPGLAKGVLVSPVKLGARFVSSLPPDRLSPETTEEREGFVHPYRVEGGADGVTVTLIARDHDGAKLEEHVALVQRLAEDAVADEPRASVSIERWDQYRNMREALDRVPHVVEAALEETRRAGLEPRVESIWGGTDGSRLTEIGLPTPNIFAGRNEFHSVREWVTVEDMASSAATVVELLKLLAE